MQSPPTSAAPKRIALAMLSTLALMWAGCASTPAQTQLEANDWERVALVDFVGNWFNYSGLGRKKPPVTRSAESADSESEGEPVRNRETVEAQELNVAGLMKTCVFSVIEDEFAWDFEASPAAKNAILSSGYYSRLGAPPLSDERKASLRAAGYDALVVVAPSDLAISTQEMPLVFPGIGYHAIDGAPLAQVHVYLMINVLDLRNPESQWVSQWVAGNATMDRAVNIAEPWSSQPADFRAEVANQLKLVFEEKIRSAVKAFAIGMKGGLAPAPSVGADAQ